MTDYLRTLLANFIVRHLRGPRSLLVAAWNWLAAEANDLVERQRCLEALLDLDPDNEQAAVALLWVLQQRIEVSELDPANAEELANIAEETGAEVLRGPLRYPSESGGWQLGDVDLSEHLGKYRGRDVTVIIASTGKAEQETLTCGICGFVLNETGECPRCKLMAEETARDVEVRQDEMRKALFKEVDEILEEGREDSTQND